MKNSLQHAMFYIYIYIYIYIYKVINKSVWTLWLKYSILQVMFKLSPARLQTFIDTPNCVLEDRVQYSTVHIPNVFCDGHLYFINCVGIVLYCNRQVHRYFLNTLCVYIISLCTFRECTGIRLLLPVCSNSSWQSFAQKCVMGRSPNTL